MTNDLMRRFRKRLYRFSAPLWQGSCRLLSLSKQRLRGQNRNATRGVPYDANSHRHNGEGTGVRSEGGQNRNATRGVPYDANSHRHNGDVSRRGLRKKILQKRQKSVFFGGCLNNSRR